MLSETNTIVDIKEQLINDYVFFGYSSDDEFEDAIEMMCDDVMRLYFYPRIGKVQYDLIADKDKIDLTEIEEYLYWAEVYATCYEFLTLKKRTTGQLQNSSNESLKVEGYAYSTGGGSSSSPNDDSLGDFYDKMFEYFKLGGFDLNSLQRTCNIFGDSIYDNTNILNIIE